MSTSFVPAYLTDCTIRGLARNTISLYRLRLAQFAHVIESHEPLLALFEALQLIDNERSKHQVFRIMRAYSRWCAAAGLGPNWMAGARLKKIEAPVPRPMTVVEVRGLLDAIKPRRKGKLYQLIAKRDRALFSVLFYSGCRRDAVRVLRRPDVDLGQQSIRVITKGGKELLRPLCKPAALELNRWLALDPDPVFVFPSLRHPGRAICASYVTHQLPIYAKDAGIERRVWVHLLRHSHAGAMAQAGVPAEVIQEDLGHAQIATTQKYLHKITGAGRLKAAVDQVFGP